MGKDLEFENVYIMDIKASSLIRSLDVNGELVIDNKIAYKYYTGCLPYSLDIMELYKLYPKQFVTNKFKKKNRNKLDSNQKIESNPEEKDKWFTDAIINIKFVGGYHQYNNKNSYELRPVKHKMRVVGKYIKIFKTKKGKRLLSQLKLRQCLYEMDNITIEYDKNKKETYSNYIPHIKINGHNYVAYKRSSSKSRIGSHLFIKKEYYDTMIKWSNMNLEFKTNELVDIASLKAYQSLTLSGIIDMVKILPHEILLVNDVKKTFEEKVSLTRLVDGKLHTENEMITITNDIFDGQSLADESLFPIIKTGNDLISNLIDNIFDNYYGCMLLRNKFAKTCAFNTRIQDFYKEQFGDEYETAFVNDMFGRKIKVKDIKLITTPNSIKLFKFAYKVADKSLDEYNNMLKEEKTEILKQCYEYWLENILPEWGVCKNEHESPFENCNQLAYQMIQSLPLTKEDIAEIIKPELKYIKYLKDEPAVLRKHINSYNGYCSKDLISYLLSQDDRFANTKMYKDYKSDIVEGYIKKLREGKIKIIGADYAIIVCNPYEMLLHSIGKLPEKPLHTGYQMYCKKYQCSDDSNKVELIGWRNPTITAGNVAIIENVWHDEFKWFNLTNNIVIENAWDCAIHDRWNGQDMDSDSCILLQSDIMLKRAKEVFNRFLIPKHDIKAENEPRQWNSKNNATVDDAISNNLIGEIVNLSQVLNSYMWHEYFKDKPDKEYIKEVYKLISQLAILSGIEIDRAKKTFSNLDSKKILKEIMSKEYKCEKILKIGNAEVERTRLTDKLYKQYEDLNNSFDGYKKLGELSDIKKKQIRPDFMEYQSDSKYDYRKFNCPMSFVIDLLDTKIEKDGEKKIKKDNIIPRAKGARNSIIGIEELLNKDIKIKGADERQIDEIKKLVNELIRYRALLKKLYKRDKTDDAEKVHAFEERIVEKIKSKKINVNTVMAIIQRAYKEEIDIKSEITTLKKEKKCLLNNKTKLWKRTSNAIDNKIKSLEKKLKISKKKQYKLKEVKLTIVGLLFKAVPKLVKECFKFDDNANISKIELLSKDEYELLTKEEKEKTCDIFGNYYKIV